MRTEARAYYDKKIALFPDAADRIFERVIPSDVSSIKKIHLSGVCGTAVGSLAALLSKKGYELSGSDIDMYPPMSDIVAALGIEFKKGFAAGNIKGADLVIIGNVCGTENPEAKAAREQGVPTLSLPEAIHRFFIEGSKSLVVAGTHGKTTTTGLLAHVFHDAGKHPGYMVGGVMQGGEESSAVGAGEYFIIEGDEYDTAYFDKSPKFLHYTPQAAIVTSLEFDHIDIYKDMGEYTDAFEFLVKEIPREGCLFLCGDHEQVKALQSEAVCETVTYGFKPGNQITSTEVLVTDKGQQFNLWIRGKEIGTFFTSLPGNHNLLNSMAVCGMALREGITVGELQKGLSNFKGMKRRQEVVAEENGITVIDDFAHHPTAVRETISAIKDKYSGRRLVAFFEPRSNTSRRKIFEEEYGKSFTFAELVFISTPALKPMDDPEHFIDPRHVVSEIKKQGIEAYAVKDVDELLEIARPLLLKGDVILIMSNGAFGGIHRKIFAV
jgi:UDP-N-acetylmuramate: L-alanyl-gamma-D-glutamyl-meso-diaminopimelate ligase